MEKESLKSLYPIIDAIASSCEETALTAIHETMYTAELEADIEKALKRLNQCKSFIEAFEKVTKAENKPYVQIDAELDIMCLLLDINKTTLKEQANDVLAFLENYKEPVLPFQNVTPDEIHQAYEDLHKAYKFVIYTNKLAGTDEECARYVNEDKDSFLGISEEEVREYTLQDNMTDREEIRKALNKIPINGLIVTGTVGRWNGQKPAFGIRKSLGEVFDAFTGDEFVLYIKDGQLKAENTHHDGTDHYTFYTCKEGVDPEYIGYIDQIDTHADVESLVPRLKDRFKWADDVWFPSGLWYYSKD